MATRVVDCRLHESRAFMVLVTASGAGLVEEWHTFTFVE